MGKARRVAGLVAGCLMFSSAVIWAAPPTADQVLQLKPRQEGVNVSTPTAQEVAACKVELVKGARKGSGWLLRDGRGQPVRRFFDSNDDNHIDIWSYYKDGVEVYREIDGNFNRKPEHYRWLNNGGSKWGVDENEDGKIDSWRIISPEEIGQEVLQALIKKDLARLQALMINEAELKSLELPATDLARIREHQKQAAVKFQNAQAKLKHLTPDKTNWVELQTGAPQCLPADQTGAKQDLIRHQRASILCETGGKDDLIQIGEMIQVGMSWRLVEAPVPGPEETVQNPSDGRRIPDDPESQKLFTDLKKLDDDWAQKAGNGSPTNPEMVKYNLTRADLLEKINAKDKPENRESWIRQLADCLAAASQSSPPKDRAAYDRLKKLVDQVVAQMPGQNLAAYVTYREMQADYSAKIQELSFEKVQPEWMDRLSKFVQTYPTSEDTPDALLQLGWGSEMIGKESEAKKWYEHLAKTFADKPASAKAKGALKRLDLEGKPLELAGPVLGGSTPFDLAKLNGKVVVVYYWASWNNQCVADFDSLKKLLASYSAKGLELVCVNVDTSVEEATSLLKRTSAPGVHLFTPGGLESKLATDYGVMVLPNLFLVGKDGKVVSRTIQVGGLDDELKKLIK